MYFNQAGLKEGAIKLLKVLGWVALSAVVAELISTVADWKPTTIEFVALQGVINAILAGAKLWLETKK